MRNASRIIALAASSWIGLTACGDDGGDAVTLDAGTDASVDARVAPGPDAGPARDGGGADGGLQSVMLRFKGKVGSQDLVCGQRYTGQGTTGTTVTPHDFRFFVHNVRLISSTGAEVPVTLAARDKYQTKDVALIDFNDGTADCDESDPGTNMVITGTVPAGNYTGVAFTPGVGEALNHGDPTLQMGPLQAPGVSWGWLLGYRFVMAEVLAVRSEHTMDGGAPDAGAHGDSAPHSRADGGTSGDGGAPSGHGAAPGLGFVHLGSGGCLPGNPITCKYPNRPEVRLMNFNVATSNIVADLGAVFAGVDLSTSVQCHGMDPACAPMFSALGVNIATGAPLATQQVFRVE